jgi:transposase
MAEELNVTYERIDDIPLLIGLMMRLKMPEILDEHLGHHGNHEGLSNGWLVVVWLAYILSEGDHCKSHVEDWVWKRRHMLARLIGQPLRRVDFSDDRLGIVLRRLSRASTWAAVEMALWHSTVTVYEIEIKGVRLDSTTSYGYHQVTEDGVMQFGHSKDHRPDLPQLKLMAAAAEPAGHLLACDVHEGQKADDLLYLPLIKRVRHLLGRTGLLYAGDCKMAALAIRADLAAQGDYYLTPLPLTGKTAAEFDTWVAAIVEGAQPVELIWAEQQLLGAGYEFERQLTAPVGDQAVTWLERVQLVRSLELARKQNQQLAQHLAQAEAALRKLTPPPGRGRRQYRQETALQTAIEQVLVRYNVTGLLAVSWQREEQRQTRYVGPGRGSAHRPTRTDVKVRYVITDLQRNEAAIQARQHRLGWRVYATNLPKEQCSLAWLVRHYRGGYCLERDFHLVKDKPLGISPLYVRLDSQIIGLTHLLTLALRLLTLIETQVRRDLAEHEQTLVGLYAGQPTRATNQPTATRLLTALARAEITLSRIEIGSQIYWHITPVPELLSRVLAFLGLSVSLYTRLVENST